MLTSILGMILSAFYIYPRSQTYGFSFFTIFILMLVASLISMMYAPIEADMDVAREEGRAVKP